MTRIVLKLGGRIAAEGAAEALALRASGSEVVVVHGAGPQISDAMERRGITPLFIGGRRVTTPEVLEVVRQALVVVSGEVCAAIGADAVPMFGDAIGLEAVHVEALGLVGRPRPSSPAAVEAALAAGRIPVVAPLAAGAPGGGTLNVNADEAAAALAIGLDADRIVFVSDVPGVFVEGVVRDSIAADEADRLLSDGTFEGGIVPKLEAAVRATRGGVHAVIGRTEVVA